MRDDHSKQWQSLSWRFGTYEFPGTAAPSLRIQDEGYMKGASPTSATPDPNADLYLHETMFGWDGWSLCVARPGCTIVPVQQGDQQEEALARVRNNALPCCSHSRRVFKWSNVTLLRYGTTYQLRARVVDLAGNSAPPDSPETAFATPPRHICALSPCLRQC
jgi:hypothetical protein